MKPEITKRAVTGAVWIGVVIVTLFLSQGISMGGVLKATPDQVNFGTIDEGENAVATIEIENTGTAPIEITNVRTS